MMPVVTEILKLDMSINLYMFHGGTNFGFMSGAFAVGKPAPKSMVTSYGMCNESVFDHYCVTFNFNSQNHIHSYLNFC